MIAGRILEAGHHRVEPDVDTLFLELALSPERHVFVDHRQHLCASLDHGHRHTQTGELFGHLEADVAGTDDRRVPGFHGGIPVDDPVHVGMAGG